MAVDRVLREAVSTPEKVIRANRWSAPVITPISILLLSLLCTGSLRAAGPTIVIYRVGDTGQNAAMSIKQSLETQGFPVVLIQGESVLEKHIEKAGAINRIPTALFLAFQYVPSEKDRRVLIAKTVAKRGEGP